MPVPPLPAVRFSGAPGLTLAASPFRGSAAIAAGLITWSRLRGRRWRRLLPDVYAHRDLPLDHPTWCAAVGLLLPPGAAIGGLSAACLWGADLIRPDALVTVVTPRDRQVRRHGRIAPHFTVLAPTDVTRLPGPPAGPVPAVDPPAADPDIPGTTGLPVTTPERTAFDLARRLRRADALVALDAMAHSAGLDLAAVAELARERRHWPRIAQLDEVVRLADSRAESPMETRLRLLVHDAGLPAPEPQLEICDKQGRLIGRVDLGWRKARLAAEYEGDHHRDRDQFRQDLARLNALRMSGWTVLRFTANDVFRTPQATAAMIASELTRTMR